MADQAADPLTVFVVDGEQSFADAVASSLEEVMNPVSAEVVTSAAETVEQIRANDSDGGVDGILVGDQLTSPFEAIQALTDVCDAPVILLTGAPDDERTVAAAIEAGVTDYFPRIVGDRHMELIAERFTDRPNQRPSSTEREHEFEQIFNGVIDPIAVYDPDTLEILDANEAFLDDLIEEDTLEDVRDRGLTQYFATEDGFTVERAREIHQRVSKTGEPERVDWKGRTREGDPLWLEVRVTPAVIGGDRVTIASHRDVTERRELERTYRDIFENVSDGLVVQDPETGAIEGVNDRACVLLGRDRSELIGATFDQVTGPDERCSPDRVTELIDTARREGPQLVEWQGTRGENRTFSMEVHLSIVEIRGEERALASLRDITDRIRREREFEQLFHGVQDPITVHDPETAEIVDMNDRFCELLGYSREEILEMGTDGYSPTNRGYTAERAKEFVHEVVETGEPKQTEWAVETSEGETRWLEVKGTTVEIGGELRYVSIDRDVTERRRTEWRLEQILDRINEAILLVPAEDLNSDPHLADYTSAGHERIWGRSFEELRETYTDGVLETVHPDDMGELRAYVDRIVADIRNDAAADTYSTEYRIERPDGELRWVRSEYYPIAREGIQPRVVVVSRDITERREREQRITSFHEATRKLPAVDSRELACKQAVEAAERALGFSIVLAYLYDEDRGELTPVAASSRLPPETDDLPSFGPGDSLPWQVFAEGESVTNSDPVANLSDLGVTGPDVVLSLGDQGVMMVGSPNGSPDSEEIELAQILAATLEAALNHVTGRHALLEREEELHRQQQRAEQFENLNNIIRDIEQVTVEQSSRADIEEAVCERLVDVDRYDLVWIAEPTVRDDELVALTSAGDKKTYLDALNTAIESGSGCHPLVRAYTDGDLQAIENIATDTSLGGWRKPALRHGIQSIVTIPVSYKNTVHGVMAIASEEPDAFDESTQDVLGELGESIGYAITIAERERALESEGTTELEFSVSDEALFMIRSTSSEGCEMELERAVRRSGGSFSTFYLVEGVAPGRLVDRASASPNIEAAQVVSSAEDGRAGLIEVTSSTWFGSIFTDFGAVVREATAQSGRGTLIVETPREADVRSLLAQFRDRYPNTELVAQRRRERTIPSLFELQDIIEDELTDRQWEVFQTAYSAGYFEWPRNSSGEEVADMLGITQPTFNKHLRLALEKTVEVVLEREPPE